MIGCDCQSCQDQALVRSSLISRQAAEKERRKVRQIQCKEIQKVNTKYKYNVSAHLVHDSVGQVVSEHVEDKAVGSRELEVVKTPGAHLSHQDRPASGDVDGDDGDGDGDDDDLSKTNFLATRFFLKDILCFSAMAAVGYFEEVKLL